MVATSNRFQDKDSAQFPDLDRPSEGGSVNYFASPYPSVIPDAQLLILLGPCPEECPQRIQWMHVCVWADRLWQKLFDDGVRRDRWLTAARQG